MKITPYKIGLGLIILGFVVCVYSPFFVIIGLPVFLIGAILVACSAKVLKIKLLIILLPLILWLPSMWLWLYSYNKYFDRSTPQTILIPENYQGRFMVVYGENCAEKPIYEKERLVLKIPENGVLLIQPPFKAGTVDDEYYLIDKHGIRTKIESLLDDDLKKKYRGVMLISSGNYGGPIKNGSSSESPLAIHFVDYRVFNKDTMSTMDEKNNDKFDSLVNAIVNQCRLNRTKVK